MYFSASTIARGWLENTRLGWLKVVLAGTRKSCVGPAVVMAVFAAWMSLINPGTYCAWLKRLTACAWNSMVWRSVMLMRFTRLMSTLLVCGRAIVLRPMFAN